MQKFINTQKEIFFGNRFFKEEALPEGYRPSDIRKQNSPYFEKHGFKVSMMYDEYYAKMNGMNSDKYVSMDLYYFYILPCLNRREFVHAYADKNNYSELFKGVPQPMPIIKNRNGLFFDPEGKPISKTDAVMLTLEYGKEAIIKPTIETGEGKNVGLLQCENRDAVIAAFEKYGVDYIVQERMKQHQDIARLNPHCLNTMRILTYRGLDGKIINMKDRTFLRIGGAGSWWDNMTGGSRVCRVFDDGHYGDILGRYKNMETFSFKEKYGDARVPNMPAAIEFAKKLHERLPFFDYIGWDITIGENGEPFFVEYNLLPEVGASQLEGGPVLSDCIDEVMERIKSVKKSRMVIDINSFRPGFDYNLQID